MIGTAGRAGAAVIGLLFSCLTAGISIGQAQTGEKFPNRPITIIVNFGAGGSTDTAVRLLAQVAEKELGVPLIIANKTGGGGTVGAAELAKAKPDGYVIGTVTSAPMTVLPAMHRVSYDPFKNFAFISGFARYPYGIYARTNSPLKSIKDVVEAARKSPGKITYGATSVGSALGLKFVELKENITLRYVPVQSGQETTSLLVGGHTDLAIGTAVFQFIESGDVNVLAVVTEDRWPALPKVPTMKELGYDIDITGWMDLAAPAGVPKERLEILYKAFKVASENPKFKATLKNLNLSAPFVTGEEIRKIYERSATAWKPLLEALKADQTKK
ncbi:MAG: tripartite tricarboxylate transporter substrate binding protein [Hyphomicrobiales bacterium]|nr:tripartite tricarboxylate transporter substrate binding protein [Hyphomicrobiales bacterium]